MILNKGGGGKWGIGLFHLAAAAAAIVQELDLGVLSPLDKHGRFRSNNFSGGAVVQSHICSKILRGSQSDCSSLLSRGVKQKRSVFVRLPRLRQRFFVD